ncbi:MAG: Heme A synthase [Rhodocyclaceae bacterium]|nr:Heme A synthase [Rhodocyclaceae bacterium]
MPSIIAASPDAARVKSAPMKPPEQRAVACWLLICAALVLLMVGIGGVTRLTHSGLSITEWQPIVGTLPPLSDADWQALFVKYQATPEYRLVNHDMDMDGFKSIFWWEYAHRLLGRGIGVVFLLPYLYFLIRGRIHGRLSWQLAGIFLLGGVQGFVGWYMVASGLVDRPSVSHFRLTVHLGLAFLIFAALYWVGLGLLAPRTSPAAGSRAARLAGLADGLVLLLFVMVLSGGLVAGLRAGKAYNTFPLMNAHFVPPEIMMIEPWWANFFFNMATVQFDHRLIAWLLVLCIPLLAWQVVRHARWARSGAFLLLGFFALQFTLGVATLLHQVPVALGAAHQTGAVLLFGAAIYLAHRLRLRQSG